MSVATGDAAVEAPPSACQLAVVLAGLPLIVVSLPTSADHSFAEVR